MYMYAEEMRRGRGGGGIGNVQVCVKLFLCALFCFPHNLLLLLLPDVQVAFVEIELGDVEVQPWLLVLFSLVTTTLVGTHLFALMISTCILPRIATTMAHKPSAESLSRSPHRHIQNYIEMSWIFRLVVAASLSVSLSVCS